MFNFWLGRNSSPSPPNSRGLNKRIDQNLQQLSLADSEAIRQAINNSWI